MHYVGNGVQVLDCVEEITYNFLNAIELSVLPTGEVVDFTTMAPNIMGQIAPTSVQCAGKILKATVDPNDIKYAGENEVMLDTLGNIKQINFLFGVFLDKLQREQGEQLLSFYNLDSEDAKGNRMISMNAKFADREVNSRYFYNKCLATIDLVFILSDYDIDLSNFNVLETK